MAQKWRLSYLSHEDACVVGKAVLRSLRDVQATVLLKAKQDRFGRALYLAESMQDLFDDWVD
jgi:hypothetical protein